MSLPSNLFSTAFREQRLGVMLSFLIGIMVYLGCLAMAAQAVLARTSVAWGHDLQNRLTIELPVQHNESAEKSAERADKALALLSQRMEIAEADLVAESETSRLLGDWIEDPALLRSLALPRLIDVEIAADQKLTADDFRRILKPVADAVQVHRHEQGMDQILGFLKGLGYLAGLMLVLTGVAIIAIIGVICRAAMAVQRDTIELMHYMGATDSVVALQFQTYVRRLAVPSAGIGFLLAVVTVGFLALMLGSLGGLSLVSPVSWVTVGGVMALVPFMASLLAIVTARLSVQRLLRRLI